ncbi:MAG: radical SAM family heme chaperone HemW [Flavobacteriaceae bacterium]|nr:radical SAM family heme chaperone HemW [Flavobacteriaceae bacterium]
MAGIYLHIPFCKQACIYCDFHFSTSLKNKEQLLDSMIVELGDRKSSFDDEIVNTIYLGGGTPSILDVSEINKLIDFIYLNYKVSPNAEISLEANPDDLTEEKIKQLSQTKINRLSIGIQSFFDSDLEYMKRAHNAKEAIESIKKAKKYGFDNISIDLIYGVPSSSNKQWEENLDLFFSLGIPHLSCYALTVEDKTELSFLINKGKQKPVSEEVSKMQFDILIAKINDNGFEQYEISNFAKNKCYSRHNTSYWKGDKYIGIGPSAHSYDGKTRSWNINNNSVYIKKINKGETVATQEVLSKDDVFNEYIMTGLRTIWGVSLIKIEDEFEAKYTEHINKTMQKYLKNNTLVLEGNILKTTDKGKFLCDGIASDLFIV